MNFDLLDEYREDSRYTIKRFCQEIGVHESTYYKWREKPSRMDGMRVDTANRIIKVLKLNQKQWTKLQK